jgi:hypothetical protein
MSNETDPLYLRKWKEEGIRYLGKEGNGHIDHLDRWQQAYIIGHADGVTEGKHEAIELAIGLLYHQYQHLKTFHSKEDDRCLILKNAILEIREAQAQEMEK